LQYLLPREQSILEATERIAFGNPKLGGFVSKIASLFSDQTLVSAFSSKNWLGYTISKHSTVRDLEEAKRQGETRLSSIKKDIQEVEIRLGELEELKQIPELRERWD